MEEERLKQIFICLSEKLKGNVIDVKINDDKAVFAIKVEKPHISFTEYVEMPLTKWFLENYSLKN